MAHRARDTRTNWGGCRSSCDWATRDKCRAMNVNTIKINSDHEVLLKRFTLVLSGRGHSGTQTESTKDFVNTQCIRNARTKDTTGRPRGLAVLASSCGVNGELKGTFKFCQS